MLDRIFKCLFFVSLAFVVYVAAIAAAYYKIPPYPAFKKWMDVRSTQTRADELAQKKAIRDARKQSPDFLRSHTYYGYTLIALSAKPAVQLIDMSGNITKEWDIQSLLPLHSSEMMIFRAELLKDGSLVVGLASRTKNGQGSILCLAADGSLRWQYQGAVHSSFAVAEDGSIFALAYETYTQPHQLYDYLTPPFTADSILHLSTDGRLLKSWPLLEMMGASRYADLLFTAPFQYTTDDLLLTNSITVIPSTVRSAMPGIEAGNLVVSLSNFNTVAVINPTTSAVSWASRSIWELQAGASISADGTLWLIDNNSYDDGRNANHAVARVLAFNSATQGIDWHWISEERYPYGALRGGGLTLLPNQNILVLLGGTSGLVEIEKDTHEVLWSYQPPQTRTQPGKPVTIFGNHNKKYDKPTRPLIPAITSAVRYDEPFIKAVLP